MEIKSLTMLFLKIYTSHYHLKMETNPWIGQFLFDLRDHQVTHTFPQINNKNLILKDLLKQQKPPYTNVDFICGFYLHTSLYRPFKEQFQSLFQPTKKVYKMIHPGLNKLQKMGKTIVGIHIRKGDYLEYKNHSRHWVAPNKWYLSWLEQIWPTLKEPVLFIASDDLTNVLPDFKHYHPVTSEELIKSFPVNVPSSLDASFYPDYYLLTQCDCLAISNSTFSFSASMLNKRCKTFMRPDAYKQKLIKYDPWNSDPHIIHIKR